MLNTHITAPGISNRNLRTSIGAKNEGPKNRPVQVDGNVVDQASLNTELNRWTAPQMCPNLKNLGRDFHVEVMGQPDQSVQNALRTGQTVALTVSAANAPILIGLDDQLRLTANGPQAHNCPVEYSSDNYAVDLHFTNDLGNEVYLSQYHNSDEKTLILREKQVPGEDWLCLTLKQNQEETFLSLNSIHNGQGARFKTEPSGRVETYSYKSDSSFNMIANLDQVGIITRTGGGRMDADKLRTALVKQRANLAAADRRVNDFLTQF